MENIEKSAKRNRNDNFDPQDIDLLLGLLEEHSVLIDSAKLDEKQKGWDLIHEKYNEGCIGIKRDIPSLKMKLKNIKTLSKRAKLEYVDVEENEDQQHNNSDQEEYEEHNQGSSSNDFKFGAFKRKRCKKFSKAECDLLIELHDKYCHNLDSSSAPNSVKKRHEAWENLTNEFNIRQTSVNGLLRDQGELKIKMKNLKAMRVKSEPSESSAVFEITSKTENFEASTPIVKNITRSDQHHQQPSNPIRIVTSSTQLANKDINNIDTPQEPYYDEFEVEYINQTPSQSKPSLNSVKSVNNDQEIERIRKENLLIKNSVLKKKERLLELQIALAERSLRRQI